MFKGYFRLAMASKTVGQECIIARLPSVRFNDGPRAVVTETTVPG